MQLMRHLHMQVENPNNHMRRDNNVAGFKYKVKEAQIW